MRLPNQAKPVARQVSSSPAAGSVGPSGIACTLCNLACDQLSGLAKTACQLACQHTVC